MKNYIQERIAYLSCLEELFDVTEGKKKWFEETIYNDDGEIIEIKAPSKDDEYSYHKYNAWLSIQAELEKLAKK